MAVVSEWPQDVRDRQLNRLSHFWRVGKLNTCGFAELRAHEAQTRVKDLSNGFWEIDAVDYGNEIYIVPG